ncbi:trypsin-like peptidase domain-containing protein [Aliifodinibius salicampi]|uniref:Trypsin-like peptidase domain-containing protein n=1 Tax=Fodinibius salicampi TaxID=1920655 RepID=A0ABT3PY77_9BACT|nr:trypsin-like peptidase domain-containing protein [Fodinibius salicampi]MCW9712822.1 trypsin-like peptidase domain-containing protein [Fodinibius salicampi]
MKYSLFGMNATFLFLLFITSCADVPQQENTNKVQRVMQASGSSLSQSTSPSANGEGTRSQTVESNSQPVTQNISQSRRTAITNAVEKVSPAVVSITVTEVVTRRGQAFSEFYNRFFSVPMEQEVSSMGSGFIISKDGLVVTNQHVAGENAKKVMISLPEGSQYEAEVLGSDELADLTLLKMDADREFPAVEFGNSDSVIVGEWSLAVGNPFGLFKSARPSVTVGVVSAKNRDFRPNPNEPRVYMDMIQTDAAINRGNSGGPLVDSEGKVIGVNTFIFTGGTSSGFVGLGFAIPSNRVQKIIRQLELSGEVQLPFDPGFSTAEMTYQLAARYNLPAVTGLLVQSVNRDGPAFEAGIVPGDIILRIGDERIQSQMHAQALMREFSEGDSMQVELWRRGDRYETEIYLRQKVKE